MPQTEPGPDGPAKAFRRMAGTIDPPPLASTSEAPVAITDDIVRLLELGKMLVGQNNPVYAATPEQLTPEKRNAAGEQALRTLQAVVKRNPRYAQGWLWLGIALTETQRYSKQAPQGKPAATPADIAAAVEAFQHAHQFDPKNEDCVKYYGDALMEYRKDFDGALKLWQVYLTNVTTDIQRTMALVQIARAYLNKSYFGRETRAPAEEVKSYYLQANEFTVQAARICPNAVDVKEMQALLQQYRKILMGK